jgi:hypothetical protein
MIVPRHLYSSTRLVDDCTGEVVFDGWLATCLGTTGIQRIDGGPEEVYIPWPVNETLVELRAFVAAEPIDILTDMNGDGVVSAEDAKLAGHNILSDEVVLRLRQILPEVGYCNGLDDPFGPFWGTGRRGTDVHVDLDENIYSSGPIMICPPGSGGYGRPPSN